MSRVVLLLIATVYLVGCGSGDSKAKINNQPLTDAEKAAIKAADDAVYAEESGGRPGSASAS